MDLSSLIIILGIAVIWELATINKNVHKIHRQNEELLSCFMKKVKETSKNTAFL